MSEAILRRAERLLEVVRGHPRHAALFAAVAGLLLARAPAPALVALALAAAMLLGCSRAGLLAAACLLVAAGWGQHRLKVTGPLPAAPLAAPAGGTAVLHEAPRRRAGHRSARAEWVGGPSDGAGVVLRLPDAAAGGRPPSGVELPAGTVLAVSGRTERLEPWEDFQRRRGARMALRVSAVRVVSAHRPGLAGLADLVRARGREGLEAGLPADVAALLQGMVIGEDHRVPEHVRKDFEASGLAHLLAVSGQNVMLLATLVLAAGAAVGAPRRVRLVAAIALVALYVPVAGGGPSVQRAGVMGAAGLLASLAGRPSARWYAIGLAAAVTLAHQPESVLEPAWQLSFAAVIGMALFAGPLGGTLRRLGAPGVFADVVAITVVAAFATAPLLAHHFGSVSLVTLPANLLAAPAVAPLMWLGMLAAALAQIDTALAAPLAQAAGVMVAYVTRVADLCAAAPHAVADVSLASWWSMAGAYGGLGALAAGGVAVWRRAEARLGSGGLLRPGRASRVAMGAGMLVAVAVGARMLTDRPPAPRPGELLVTFLDVGQGDATLLRTHDAAVLVDTGPADGRVLERLDEAGVDALDALILTHAQDDHEGAAPEVIAATRPRVVVNGGAGWDSAVQRELPGAARMAGAHVATLIAGQRIGVGELKLRALWPADGDGALVPGADPNETALVLHGTLGAFDLLLPADAESGVLSALELGPVEVLKVSHHGSEDEGLPALLERLRPAVAVIEVGHGNSYGHPHPGTLAALRAVPRVARTDRDGTVSLLVSGGRMRWLG